uniref:Uncharacterized protein n=1 Tax=Tetranychus urticae TaxID=32264 RepID=T1KV91_TETUR
MDGFPRFFLLLCTHDLYKHRVIKLCILKESIF